MRKLNLEVYSSGVPHFFTYGICTVDNNTYCLIDNQYWVRASNNLSNEELSEMHFIAVHENCFTRD